MSENLIFLDACPVCGNGSIHFVAYGLINEGLHRLLDQEPRKSKWYHCGSCNHIFLNPKFSRSIENRLYGEESLYRVYSIGDNTVAEYLKSIDNTIGNSLVHRGHLKKIKELLSIVPLREGSSVLDFGAGFGAASSAFNKLNMHYQGYEFDDFCLDIARNNERNVKKNVEKVDSYDLVYSSQVFEHISQPKSAIDDIADFLKIGGYVYINVPTHQYQLFPPKNIGFGGLNCMNWGHFHSYSQSSLRQLIEQSGKFKIIKVWFNEFDVNAVAQRVDEECAKKEARNYSTQKEKLRINIARYVFSPMHNALFRVKTIVKQIIGR